MTLISGGRRANSKRNMMISMVSKSDAPALLQSETARHNRNLRAKMSVSSSIDELTASMPELQAKNLYKNQEKPRLVRLDINLRYITRGEKIR